jgi:hypothetical protein
MEHLLDIDQTALPARTGVADQYSAIAASAAARFPGSPVAIRRRKVSMQLSMCAIARCLDRPKRAQPTRWANLREQYSEYRRG